MITLKQALTGLLLALTSLTAGAAERVYNLTIAKETVRITADPRERITVNGSIPGPILTFTEGDEAVIHVTNAMKIDSSVHWHGLLLPGFMDGAPGFNGFKGIKPGETFTYRFPIRQAGTYWYHAHNMGQEQDGLYGAIVINPRDPEPQARDHVILLSDFHKETARQILGNLKKSSDWYQWNKPTLGESMKDLKDAADWGRMRMWKSDLSDVSGYDFLMNGKTARETFKAAYTPGESVRLRFINAGTMTFFDIRIPGLKLTVIAADGQPVEPVTVDEFRIGSAEIYDVMVTPEAGKTYAIAAESLDRNGFALGTLSPDPSARAEVPPARPRARLTMGDMNMEIMMRDDPDMDMSGMDHSSGWAKSGAPADTRVLHYRDLKTLHARSASAAPTRTIEVRLGGNMERYIWTMNGKKFDPAVSIPLSFGERVRIRYINETMMAHPIHLHGMFVELENGPEALRYPLKHTVIVPPGKSETVLLTADEPGLWPFHCHLLYHMESGMMTAVDVSPPGAPSPAPVPLPAQKTEDKGGHRAH